MAYVITHRIRGRPGLLLRKQLTHETRASSRRMLPRPTRGSTRSALLKRELQPQASSLEKVWDLEELGRLRSALLYWYDVEARQLPWRQRNGRPDPYQVYVSEVMLQQTRVSTVKTYFKHWMERFPTVQALAAASEEDVLQQWAGLGYYRRARMLHAGARWLVTHHGGELPTSVQELTQVPGIGEYTAGAIASIAFGQCVPAVDGNAIRVLSRLAGLDAMNVWKGAGKRYLMTLASALVDPERPGDWNQAIFDLGSAVCIPQLTEHACGSCPLRTFCKAAHLPVEAIQRIPYLRTTTQGDAPKIQRQMPRARVRRELVHAFVLVANDLDAKQGHPHDPVYFVRRRAANGLLGGLWEVPNLVVERFDVGASTQAEDSELSISLASRPPLERESCDAFERLAEALASPTLPSSAIRSMTLVPERVRHLFTHIRQDILVFRVEVSAPSLFLDQTRNGQWVSATSLREMGLSTQMRKVLRAASVSLPRKRFAETSLTDECENAQP